MSKKKIPFFRYITPDNFNFYFEEEQIFFNRLGNKNKFGIVFEFKEDEEDDNLYSVKWHVVFGEEWERSRARLLVRDSDKELSFRMTDWDDSVYSIDEFIFNKIKTLLRKDVSPCQFKDWLKLFRE